MAECCGSAEPGTAGKRAMNTATRTGVMSAAVAVLSLAFGVAQFIRGYAGLGTFLVFLSVINAACSAGSIRRGWRQFSGARTGADPRR